MIAISVFCVERLELKTTPLSPDFAGLKVAATVAGGGWGEATFFLSDVPPSRLNAAIESFNAILAGDVIAIGEHG